MARYVLMSMPVAAEQPAHVADISMHALSAKCLDQPWCLLWSDGIELGEEERDGVFRLAQYGQIYSLTSRLNELMLRVSV